MLQFGDKCRFRLSGANQTGKKLLKAGKPSSLGTESQPAKVYFTLLTTHYVHLQRVTTRARLTISIKARRNRNGPNLNRHTLI